jgi:hypothetical protein
MAHGAQVHRPKLIVRSRAAGACKNQRPTTKPRYPASIIADNLVGTARDRRARSAIERDGVGILCTAPTDAFRRAAAPRVRIGQPNNL